ncbi:MAG TPA: hypothetical protein VIR57_06955 [Chloroflexota bacterium]
MQRAKFDDPQIVDAGYRVMVEVMADNPAPLIEDIASVLPLFDGQGKNPADFVDPAPLARAIQELGAAKS